MELKEEKKIDAPIVLKPLSPRGDLSFKEIEVYSNAIDTAVKEPSIMNVALTGPYSAGKSSIIKSFENNTKYRTLNISLATFSIDSKKGDDSSRQLIEKSILQQMIYGPDSKKLYYSRFKRIVKPNLKLTKSIILALWLILLYLFFCDSIILQEVQSVIGRKKYWVILISANFILFTALFWNIFKSLPKLAVKKITLNQAEIETDNHEESIFNRYLEEILYFFEETDYDLIVIEDLDRFDDPHIFTRLREIDKLVNDNANRKAKKIVFLYAIKDHIFTEEERTKFFDLIIPIVPVVNTQNAFDYFKRYFNDEGLEEDFLRRVSLFINDLRFIKNINNEFAIYKIALQTSRLDLTKLLAIIIYKNAFPVDFEDYHNSKGVLYDLLRNRDSVLKEKKIALIEKEDELQEKLNRLADETILTKRELIFTYIGAIQATANQNQKVHYICLAGENYSIQDVDSIEVESFLDLDDIYYYYNNNVNQSYKVKHPKTFSEIQKDINPRINLKQRLELIEEKVGQKKSDILEEIDSIKSRIKSLSKISIGSALSDDRLDEKAGKDFKRSKPLFTFLIKEGYIDDDCHHYVTSFTEGRLSRNDREFLLSYYTDNPLPYDFELKELEEIIKDLNKETIDSLPSLNFDFFDYVLRSDNKELIEKIISIPSKDSSGFSDFLSNYYENGKEVALLVEQLIVENDFYSRVLKKEGSGALEHASILLEHIDIENFKGTGSLLQLIKEVSEKYTTELIEISNFQKIVSALFKLDSKIRDLCSVEDRYGDGIVQQLVRKELFEVNLENLLLIARFNGLDQDDFKSNCVKHIYEFKDRELKEYLLSNKSELLEKVILVLNGEAPNEKVAEFLQDEKVYLLLKKQLISQVGFKVDDIDLIDRNLWLCLLEFDRINIDWETFLKIYLHSEDNEWLKIVDFLNDETRANPLYETVSNLGSDWNERGKNELSSYLAYEEELDYKAFKRLIPLFEGAFDSIPDTLSDDKIEAGILANAFPLNSEVFSKVCEKTDLAVELIKQNREMFKESHQEFVLPASVKASLLSENELQEDIHQIVIKSISCDEVGDSPELAKSILKISQINRSEIDGLEENVLLCVLGGLEKDQDKVEFLTYIISQLEVENVYEIVTDYLPSEFHQIRPSNRQPTIQISKVNEKFLSLLAKKGLISSFKTVKGKKFRIFNVKEKG